MEKIAVAASQTLNQESVSEFRDAEKICPTHLLSPVDSEVRRGQEFNAKEYAQRHTRV